MVYLIKDTTRAETSIDFAYDLYAERRLENFKTPFYSPYERNNMVAYNPNDGKIYTWDKGNQLTYLLLLGEQD